MWFQRRSQWQLVARFTSSTYVRRLDSGLTRYCYGDMAKCGSQGGARPAPSAPLWPPLHLVNRTCPLGPPALALRVSPLTAVVRPTREDIPAFTIADMDIARSYSIGDR